MIKRDKYLIKIEKELKKKDTVLFLIGARQVGKSTLLSSLTEFNYISSESLIRIDGDKIYDNKIKSGDDFLAFIKTKGNLDNMDYLIIDEAQYISNIGIILKNLIDDIRSKKLDFKIIVSGSGSLNVFKGITDTLTGRKKIIQVRTFDFEEFCLAKGLDSFQITESNISVYKQLFTEYSLFGGYPKVVLTDDITEKQEIFIDLLNDYLFKDIALLLSENDIINLKNCLKALATYTCSLVKMSTIAKEIGISRYNLEKYFFVLENTFLFDVVHGFVGGKVGGETKKMTKFYCQDVGFLRFLLGVSSWEGTNKGKLAETFVINELKSNLSSIHEILFWHTKSGVEVDFVIRNMFDSSLIPLEVKAYNSNSILSNMESFYSHYGENISKGIMTTDDLFLEKKTKTDKVVSFVPYLNIKNSLK